MSDERNSEILLCRICLTNSQSSSMVSIFNDDTLWKQIKSFAEVEIIQGDHLPQQVCLACADTIFNISVFKKKCEEADAFYRLELLKGLDYHYKPKAFAFQPPVDTGFTQRTSSFTHEIDEDDYEDETCSSSDDDENDDLPLIPEIELVTPNEDDDDNDDHIPEVPFTENQVDGHVVSYECSTCNKKYLNRRFMEKHVRRDRCMQKRKNQTRPMQCSNCQVVFPSGHHYGWHKRNGCPSNSNGSSLLNYNIQPAYPSYLDSMTSQNSMINSVQKTKGRNRIKLDAALLNAAKNLVVQGATTSQLAEHLNISRTFAWRLRKNMLNGRMSPLPQGVQQPIVIDDDEQPGCSKSVEKRKIRKFVKREKTKTRKPNVFINDEMYERAKEYIDQNMSTLEIARHLNISQMTAWKLRDAITKGIKLTFREKQPKKQPNNALTREKRMSLKKKIKAQERLERDKEISKEILNIVKDDMGIQYWKISEKLAQKGYSMSTSSVCQKLKAMGIRRRFKCHEKQRQQEEEEGQQDGDVNFNNNFITEFKEEANEQASEDSDNLVLSGGHFMSLGL
ncbi:hypothetical protein ACFFRR_001604 [Megaselia abdita]